MSGCGGEDSGKAPARAESGTGFPTSDAPTGTRPAGDELTVLFFGDSITAGYGLTPDEAFPALLQERIDERSWPVRVVNSGLSGETSAGGLRRISWVLREPVDVFVLELGGNDALRGVDLRSTHRNLQAIIDTVQARSPDVRIVVAGMMIPPNFGAGYADAFRRIYPDLAEDNGAALIPFLFEGVGGVPGMMQADGIHPTAEGHERMAENTWVVLEPVLREALGERAVRP